MRRKDLARALYTSAAMNLYGEKIIWKVATFFWKKVSKLQHSNFKNVLGIDPLFWNSDP